MALGKAVKDVWRRVAKKPSTAHLEPEGRAVTKKTAGEIKTVDERRVQVDADADEKDSDDGTDETDLAEDSLDERLSDEEVIVQFREDLSQTESVRSAYT